MTHHPFAPTRPVRILVVLSTAAALTVTGCTITVDRPAPTAATVQEGTSATTSVVPSPTEPGVIIQPGPGTTATRPTPTTVPGFELQKATVKAHTALTPSLGVENSRALLFQAINDRRAARGAAPLKTNPDFTRDAQAAAAKAAEINRISNLPEITPKRNVEQFVGLAGVPSGNIIGMPRDAVHDATFLWTVVEKSTPHLVQQLTDPKQRVAGIGVAYSADGTVFFSYAAAP